MPKVHCKRPNAPLNINGHVFVPHPEGGTVSKEELSADEAAALVEVGGYEVFDPAAKKPAPPAKPSHGMNAAQIKAELGRRNVTIPEGVTAKADLAALLDAQPAAAASAEPAPAGDAGAEGDAAGADSEDKAPA